MQDDNPNEIMYIGNKTPTDYVKAIVTRFQTQPRVILKARGKAISTACDAEQILKGRYMPDVITKEILLLTEVMEQKAVPEKLKEDQKTPPQKNRTHNVTVIKITLEKKQP